MAIDRFQRRKAARQPSIAATPAPRPDDAKNTISRLLWPFLAKDMIAQHLRNLADRIERGETSIDEPRGVIILACGVNQFEVIHAGDLDRSDFERAAQKLTANVDRLADIHQGGQSPR